MDHLSYCKQCGNSLAEGEQYCTSCGTKQTGTTKKTETNSKKVTTSEKTMSKRSRVLIGIFVGVVILLFGAHFALSSFLDPIKQIKAMDRAVSEQNSDTFLDYVTIDEEALMNSEEYVSSLANADWEAMREQFMVHLEDGVGDFDQTVTDSHGHERFIVKKNDIALGLYTTYEIEALPFHVSITSNYDHSAFAIEDINIKVEKANEPSKPFKAYPGTYEVTGTMTNAFGEITMAEEITVTSQESQTQLNFPESNAWPTSDVDGATLFVNGESTKKTVEEFEALGPFPKGKEVSMHAEWKTPDGETIKSEPITEDGDDFGNYHFAFELPVMKEEGKEAVKTGEEFTVDAAGEFVLGFRDAYEFSLNERDYSYIEEYLLDGSDADIGLSEYIGDLKDEDYTYDFTENFITGAEQVKKGLFKVFTNEKFLFTNHLGDQIDYEREKIYTVVTHEKGYQIKKIDINETNRNEL
ncbi:hypothetical protein MUO14_05920 [Halobacillus shinanisalinarum]|uniref:Zinc-ribbon domain-containing protein n=1 Tax=Halobacillus shinanisalinarum TaxID=2932258 RepID=A0ABY4H2F5_9BACI|nr:hypothetical protein [Halobacillus shinanisalinarum]UOQ94489.1 hypothetical protein MUO14_05920 [Halobacillus shinanisalinarum]